MKKLTILSIIFIIFTNLSISQSGWFTQYSGISNHLRSVYFINPQTGWVGGFVNAYAKTTNGGNNWTSINWFNPESILSFYFLNDLTGWAGGGTENNSHCLITKTTDGGLTWVNQYFNTSTGLNYKLFFLDGNRGWASCGKGNVLLTTNGGQIWTLVNTGTTIPLTGCFFINQNTGWVDGSNGTILKTIDGGNSWSPQLSGTSQNLQGMYFINSTTGFIAGYNGGILKTTDAGINWISKPSGTTQWLNSVKFINSNTGWCVGGNYSSSSLILQTTNSGENWTVQSSSTNFLTDVFFINSLTGWAVGNNGAIIKTTNGGISPPSAPPAPTLVSPSNNSTNISTTPTMVWNASSGATNYKIQISTVANFFVISDSATVTTTQYVVPVGKLSAGYTYFWRVNASNSLGTSSWSSIWNFSTVLLPSAPVLLSPPNGFIGTSTTPTLTWSSLSNVLYYKVQISRVSNFSFMIDSATRTTPQYTVPAGKLFDNITYFWRVNATNEFGNGPWSSVWSFTPQPDNINLIGYEIPTEYKLYNNYPNPFNPVTKIRFDIAKPGFVNIKVFSIQGKEIASLVYNMLSAGSFETSWDATSYSSGVYYYRIQTSEFTDTKRMVLVK